MKFIYVRAPIALSSNSEQRIKETEALFNEPNEKVQLFESIDKFTRDDFGIVIPTVPSEKTLKIRQRFQ